MNQIPSYQKLVDVARVMQTNALFSGEEGGEKSDESFGELDTIMQLDSMRDIEDIA